MMLVIGMLYISNSSRSIKNSNRSNGPSNCGNLIWYVGWLTVEIYVLGKKDYKKSQPVLGCSKSNKYPAYSDLHCGLNS